MKTKFILILSFLLGVFLCLTNHGFSQNLITNGGFETVHTSGIVCESPFRTPTRVQGWEQAHGSPQIQTNNGGACNQNIGWGLESGNNFFYGNFSGPPTYGGQTYPADDEGIYQNLTLQGGKAYQVSMKVSTSLFVFEACNGLTPYDGNASIPLPNISSSDRQEIFHQSANGSLSTLFYPKKTFSQVWIHADPSNVYAGTTKMDDVVITEVNPINQLSGTTGLICSATQFQIPISSSYYNWSVPSGNASISGSGNTVTVAPNIGSGYITISVSVDNGYTYNITVYTGPPPFAYVAVNGQPTSNATVCVNNFASIEAQPFVATASYTWSLSNPGNAYITNYYNANTAFNSYTADCYYLSLQISNACGSTQSTLTICSQNCFARYTVQPNPARDYLIVQFDEVDKVDALPDNIELYSDSSTKPIRAVNIQEAYNKKALKDGNKIQFDVQDLPRGTYYLHVTNSRQTKEKQLEKIRVILE